MSERERRGEREGRERSRESPSERASDRVRACEQASEREVASEQESRRSTSTFALKRACVRASSRGVRAFRTLPPPQRLSHSVPVLVSVSVSSSLLPSRRLSARPLHSTPAVKLTRPPPFLDEFVWPWDSLSHTRCFLRTTKLPPSTPPTHPPTVCPAPRCRR